MHGINIVVHTRPTLRALSCAQTDISQNLFLGQKLAVKARAAFGCKVYIYSYTYSNYNYNIVVYNVKR